MHIEVEEGDGVVDEAEGSPGGDGDEVDDPLVGAVVSDSGHEGEVIVRGRLALGAVF